MRDDDVPVVDDDVQVVDDVATFSRARVDAMFAKRRRRDVMTVVARLMMRTEARRHLNERAPRGHH